MTRDQIYQALFDKLVVAADFSPESSRRLKHWSQVNAQPALFVVEGPYQHYPDGDYLRPRMPAFDAEVWIYSKGGENPDEPPARDLDRLIDAVEFALHGDQPFRLPQTLGIDGVLYARIEGRIEIDPGHLAGQAIAIVPVVIRVAESFLVGGI